MKSDRIVFRIAPQPAPTKPGWYYARSKVRSGPGGEIQPRYVGEREPPITDWGLLFVDMHSERVTGELDEFEWFGPVPECIEARVPA